MTVSLTNLNYEALVRKGTVPSRESSDGVIEKLWAQRDGALVGMDWYTALAMEGRCFVVDTATGTTPDTFNGTYGAAEPDLYLYVPEGSLVMPLYIEVGFEDTATAQVMDVFALASNTEDADRTITGTVEPINNLRTDRPRESNCLAYSVVTGALTDPMAGNYYEFWRPYMGFSDDAFNGSIPWRVSIFHGVSWSAKNATVPPIVMNAGCVAIWASANAGTGYITLVFAELPSSSYK